MPSSRNDPTIRTAPSITRTAVSPTNIVHLLRHAAEASVCVCDYLRSGKPDSTSQPNVRTNAGGDVGRATDIAESLGQLLQLSADLIRNETGPQSAEVLEYPTSLFVAPLLLQMRHARGIACVELNDQILSPPLDVVHSSPEAVLRLLKVATDLSLDGVKNASIVLHLADAPRPGHDPLLIVAPMLLSDCPDSEQDQSDQPLDNRASAEAAARLPSLNADAVSHAQHTVMWLADMLGVSLTFPENRAGLWRLSIPARVSPSTTREVKP